MTLNQDFKIRDALDVLCAQLTRDLFAITKFLFFFHGAGSIADEWRRVALGYYTGGRRVTRGPVCPFLGQIYLQQRPKCATAAAVPPIAPLHFLPQKVKFKIKNL